MKSEFEARPVHLSREDRIKAHFITCFLALVIYRFLEKKMEEKYTTSELIKTLKQMNFLKEGNNGYSPVYTRTDITDELHDKFGDFVIEGTAENNKGLVLRPINKPSGGGCGSCGGGCQ